MVFCISERYIAATSDGLVQLSSLRSGVLRMSARELYEELERTRKEMEKHFKK